MIYQLKKMSWLRFNLMSENWRFGKEALKYYKFLSESQWWSQEQLEEYQWQKLIALIKHAYDNSPYYRRIYDARGIKPEDIRTWADYRQLPYLTKDDLKENLAEITLRNIDQYQIRDVKTSGSTGLPLRMLKNQNTEDMRLAISYRNRAYAGVDYSDVELSTWSQYTIDEEKEPYNYDPIIRNLNIRASMPDEKRLKLLIRKYREFEPISFSGYGAVFAVLGKYLEKHKITDIKPRAIFIQSEAFSDTDRQNLERWFDCKIYDYYGMRENAASASECQEGRMHINSEFTYLEFENNHQPAKPDELAVIIGTSLFNYAVPLLRYYTNDMGRYFDEECNCGRKLLLMKIEGGRSRDFVVTPGKLVFVTHHLLRYLDITSGIDKLQIYQPDRQNLIVRLVKNKQFKQTDEQAIIEALKKLINDELFITPQYLDDIPHTKLGKFQYVISDIKAEI